MKSSKKSTIKKKYQTAGMVTPALPKSGPELTYPADVTYDQENITGAFPTGQPLGEFFPIQFPDLQSKQLEPTQIKAPISFGEISLGDKTTKEAKITPTQKPYNPQLDYNSMFTLGLGLTSMGLNQREEQRNRRLLNESIQQRQSQPLYDYNYMYGRTTSGGTEFQPIVKAEMGAQINKRYDSPSSINNVEIEGGEYLQLPDMSTEMAYGPSHSRGGIETSLPEGTRVYSNHLKPMGSKKTFAQMAKKYDNSDYDKILNNKFAKQVDKDTAAIMRDKNQKVLDKLFMDQQMMNGNSNGEPMAKNGASINNAGFRALPKAVQDQIISNMEYGGYSLPKLQGGDWYTSGQWDAAMQQPVQPTQENWYNEDQWDAAQGQSALTNLPRVTQNRITNPGFNTSAPQPKGLGYSMNASIAAQRPGSQTAFVQPIQQQNIPVTGLDANSLMSRPQGSGVISPFGQVNTSAAPGSFPSTQSPQTAQPQTTNKKNTASTKSTKSTKSTPSNLSNNDKAIPTYTEEEIERIRKYDPNFNPILGTVPGMQRTVDGVYGSKKNIDIFKENYDWYLPKFKEQYGRDLDPRSKEDMGKAQKAFQEEAVKRFIDLGYTPEQAQTEAASIGFTTEKGLPNSFDEMLGFYTATRKLPNAAPKDKTQATSETPETETKTETKTETNETVNTPGFTSVTGQGSGKYYRQPFPLEQAIPNVMGLAASQETFPYAIPEIDSPSIRPQTLNIQSQLQDIDNMGQAAVRGGADPLSTYIAGIGGKEKAFQSKQNFDAQGRMQADMFNAQAQQRANMMNAQLFDRTYNNLIARARDAATAEQQASIANLLQKKAKYDQDENLKSLYLDNLQSAFEIGKDRPYSMTVDPQGRPTFSYGILPAQVDMPTKGRTTKTKKDETKTTDVVPSEKITTTRRTR